MEKILTFLQETEVFYYATVDGDKPRVRPFGFFMEYEGKLYFGMGKHKQSYAQTLANPNVEIATTNSKGQWLRIRGTAVFDERQEVMDKVLATAPTLKELYNEKTGQTFGNFYIKDGVAEIADMDGNFESFSF